MEIIMLIKKIVVFYFGIPKHLLNGYWI